MGADHGTAEMLGLLVYERGIKPHIPVFDKSQRTDGTLSPIDFAFDHARDLYACPQDKELQQYRRKFDTPRDGVDADGHRRLQGAARTTPRQSDS